MGHFAQLSAWRSAVRRLSFSGAICINPTPAAAACCSFASARRALARLRRPRAVGGSLVPRPPHVPGRLRALWRPRLCVACAGLSARGVRGGRRPGARVGGCCVRCPRSRPASGRLTVLCPLARGCCPFRWFRGVLLRAPNGKRQLLGAYLVGVAMPRTDGEETVFDFRRSFLLDKAATA